MRADVPPAARQRSDCGEAHCSVKNLDPSGPDTSPAPRSAEEEEEEEEEGACV